MALKGRGVSTAKILEALKAVVALALLVIGGHLCADAFLPVHTRIDKTRHVCKLSRKVLRETSSTRPVTKDLRGEHITEIEMLCEEDADLGLANAEQALLSGRKAVKRESFEKALQHLESAERWLAFKGREKEKERIQSKIASVRNAIAARRKAAEKEAKCEEALKSFDRVLRVAGYNTSRAGQILSQDIMWLCAGETVCEKHCSRERCAKAVSSMFGARIRFKDVCNSIINQFETQRRR